MFEDIENKWYVCFDASDPELFKSSRHLGSSGTQIGSLTNNLDEKRVIVL